MPITPEDHLASPRRDERSGETEPGVKGSLVADGLLLPPPEILTDREVGRWLWQTVGWLAGRSCFLLHTDHLSDRELYARLFRFIVPEELDDDPLPPGGFSCADMTASGSEEDEEALMRYYADDEMRRMWGWSDLAPREDPPFDRDRFLPGMHLPSELTADSDDEPPNGRAVRPRSDLA